MKKRLHPDSEILDQLAPGTNAIAERLGVKNYAISKWRRTGVPWPQRFWVYDMIEQDGGTLPDDWLRNREQ